MYQVLRERAIGMLTVGMSTRAVARELNVGGVFLSVIKPFCGEKLILISWAWLPSGWVYALSCQIHRLGPNLFISID
jgi:hypothetical protein